LPVFLIVLLVLSALNIVLGVFPIISVFFQGVEEQYQAIEVLLDQQQKVSSMQGIYPSIMEEMTEFYNIKKDNLILENNLTLLIYLFEMYGLFLMFKLRKNGFWIYLVSQFTFFVLFASIYPGYNLFTTAVFVTTFITLLIFGIAYWTQTKYMSN
jgi:hypothetical protein